MTNKQYSKTDNNSGQLICPECGGQGIILNYNHLMADISWEHRYVPCKRYFGIGIIPNQIYGHSEGDYN